MVFADAPLVLASNTALGILTIGTLGSIAIYIALLVATCQQKNL